MAPRSGSKVNHRHLTAAMIDSRDFLAARRRAETELLVPAGPKIAFTGGADFNDHPLIWDTLDKVRAKHPGMVLLHGGSPTGAERIAARWADTRKVTHSLQARLDPSRQGRTLQAQRPDSGGPADRRHRVPGIGHPGKSRRQGLPGRHPGLALRLGRRVSARHLRAIGDTVAGSACARVSGVYCTRRRSHRRRLAGPSRARGWLQADEPMGLPRERPARPVLLSGTDQCPYHLWLLHLRRLLENYGTAVSSPADGRDVRAGLARRIADFIARLRVCVCPLQSFPSIGHVITAEASQLRRLWTDGTTTSPCSGVFERSLAAWPGRDVRARPILGSSPALLFYLQTAMAYQQIEQFRILFLDRKNPSDRRRSPAARHRQSHAGLPPRGPEAP